MLIIQSHIKILRRLVQLRFMSKVSTTLKIQTQLNLRLHRQGLKLRKLRQQRKKLN